MPRESESLMDAVARMDRMDRRDGALLRKVGDAIFAEPERYDQRFWAKTSTCGTTACVAGHVVTFMDGFERVVPRDDGACDDVVVYGEVRFIADAATAALRLTEDEWRVLFHYNWEPTGDPSTPLHERVRDALYALADGATVEEVTAS